MMARLEAGPCGRWPKMLKGGLETTLESQKTWSENMHSDSLKKGINLLVLRVRLRREMMLLIMKMMMQ